MGFSDNSTTAISCNDPSRELIFIQAGPASNWIGAHFWNLQEDALFRGIDECDFHIPALFRAGINKSTTSLRPRLISIDTIGSIGGPQLDVPSSMPYSVAVAWDGDVQTISRFSDQNYSNGQNGNSQDCQPLYWTGCLLPTVRRRWKGEDTVAVIRDYLDSSTPGDLLSSPSNLPQISAQVSIGDEAPSCLSLFSQGMDLYRPGGGAFDYFEIYFHRLVEECDRPSGFCLLIDSDSGFSGVGLRLGEFLSEEFSKRAIFTSAAAASPSISPGLQTQCQQRRWSNVSLNRVALFASLEEATTWPSCSTWLPLAHSEPGDGGACVAASRLAAGLTTLLSPMLLSREKENAMELHKFIDALTPTRKKMLSLSLVNRGLNASDGFKWLHANTFSSYQGLAQPSSYPGSISCQLSSRGVDLKGRLDSILPHSRGSACSLERGLELQLTCALPTLPLAVPRLSTVPSPCSQPDRSTALTALEAVSHWTEEGQWLARGLKHHMDSAFRSKIHASNLEEDELLQIRESATDHLIEAYASPDG